MKNEQVKAVFETGYGYFKEMAENGDSKGHNLDELLHGCLQAAWENLTENDPKLLQDKPNLEETTQVICEISRMYK